MHKDAALSYIRKANPLNGLNSPVCKGEPLKRHQTRTFSSYFIFFLLSEEYTTGVLIFDETTISGGSDKLLD